MKPIPFHDEVERDFFMYLYSLHLVRYIVSIIRSKINPLRLPL